MTHEFDIARAVILDGLWEDEAAERFGVSRDEVRQAVGKLMRLQLCQLREYLEAKITDRLTSDFLPKLPADLQSVTKCYYLGIAEREAAEQLGITRHEYRDRLDRALKIIAPHIRCLVAHGAGI